MVFYIEVKTCTAGAQWKPRVAGAQDRVSCIYKFLMFGFVCFLVCVNNWLMSDLVQTCVQFCFILYCKKLILDTQSRGAKAMPGLLIAFKLSCCSLCNKVGNIKS